MASLFPAEEEIDGLLTGPESISWQYGSDPRLYLVMLYPLLLQVAHPVVAAGVRDFSDFEARPWDRLLGTLDYVTMLIYGGRDAVGMGRRLRAMHKRFRGTREDGRPYYALEPEAYAWVHATLILSYVDGHAQFARPMNPDQRQRFLGEYLGLGRLIGVREGDLPDDWAAFRRYTDAMIDEQLGPTQSVTTVLRAVRDPKAPPLPIPRSVWRGIRVPARRALWLGSVGLLPDRLRDRLGIPWSSSDARQFRRLGAATRACTPLMPPALRTVGPAQLRMRRRAMQHGPLGPNAAES
jgi:uncharacterized protein (DUF2236 family)